MSEAKQTKFLRGWEISLMGVILIVIGVIFESLMADLTLVVGVIFLFYGALVGVYNLVQQSSGGKLASDKVSHNKKLYAFGAVGVGLLIIVIAYPMYARDFCSKSANRNYVYSKDGELYSALKLTSGERGAILTRDNYLRLCMQEKFKL